MNILAFETSCDDTSVSLLTAETGAEIPHIRSLSIQSQWEVHSRFGGVVPELASRAHLTNLLPCLEKTLKESQICLDQVDLFAATHAPGLIGCLLIGHTAAKVLSLLYSKPFVSCNHLEGHLMSVLIENNLEFPFLSLVVSGGHTSLYRMNSPDAWKLLGYTLDDAAGEAFDKGGKLLQFPLPGGPEIDRIAKNGNPSAFPFSRPQVPELDFSFSGIKSELARQVKKFSTGEPLSPEMTADLAASYQFGLVRHLLDKTKAALRSENLSRLAIVGGVARNSSLRKELDVMKLKGELQDWAAPSAELCTDNAAMIGVLAYRKSLRGEFSDLSADVLSTSRPPRKRKSDLSKAP